MGLIQQEEHFLSLLGLGWCSTSDAGVSAISKLSLKSWPARGSYQLNSFRAPSSLAEGSESKRGRKTFLFPLTCPFAVCFMEGAQMVVFSCGFGFSIGSRRRSRELSSVCRWSRSSMRHAMDRSSALMSEMAVVGYGGNSPSSSSVSPFNSSEFFEFLSVRVTC